MSKATEFKEHMDKTRELRPMPIEVGCRLCRVGDDGEAMIGNYIFTPEEMILLRDWITENFE